MQSGPMIYNQWYIIARSSEIPKKKAIPIRRLGIDLVLWRDARNRIVCMRDRCPHRHAKISDGRGCDGRFRCPYHGLQFYETGSCRYIPANGSDGIIPKSLKAELFRIEEVHGFVWLWWGEYENTLPPLPWFNEFNQCISHISLPYVWPTHYTRIIENLLDAAHVPVVHGKSFGRYFSESVDPMGGVLWEDGRMKLITTLRLKKNSQSRYLRMVGVEDDGSAVISERPENIPKALQENCLDVQFQFPGYWRVDYRYRLLWRHHRDDFYSAVFITPIDEHNTLFYIACYQKLVTLPVIGPFLCWISNLYDRKIGLREDKQVVLG